MFQNIKKLSLRYRISSNLKWLDIFPNNARLSKENIFCMKIHSKIFIGLQRRKINWEATAKKESKLVKVHYQILSTWSYWQKFNLLNLAQRLDWSHYCSLEAKNVLTRNFEDKNNETTIYAHSRNAVSENILFQPKTVLKLWRCLLVDNLQLKTNVGHNNFFFEIKCWSINCNVIK